MSLWGKALGYSVVANDVAVRSEAVGRAFIENDSATLSDEDVLLVMEADASEWYLPPVKALPWPDKARALLAQCAKVAESYEDPTKKYLMRALLIKVATRIAMWGEVDSSGGLRIREERWDEIPASQSGRNLEPFVQPKRELVNCARAMRNGVFGNGQVNTMSCEDVLAFIARTEGDVAYLDPPYPGTKTYERTYWTLDSIMENRELRQTTSRFSKTDGWKFLGDVFDAAEHIPVWVLSLGNESVDEEPLIELMKARRRKVEAEVLEYAHLQSKATAAKTEGNKEFIITAAKEA